MNPVADFKVHGDIPNIQRGQTAKLFNYSILGWIAHAIRIKLTHNNELGVDTIYCITYTIYIYIVYSDDHWKCVRNGIHPSKEKIPK